MTTQVIQTKRQPPLWTVKAGGRIKEGFIGDGARERAEAYAAHHHGDYEVLEKTKTGKELKREAQLAALAEAAE